MADDEGPTGTLTTGSLLACSQGKVPKEDFIVQVLSGRKNTSGRVQVVVHDVKHKMECLLDSKFSSCWGKSEEGGIIDGTILQFNSGKINPIGGLSVLLGDNMEILQTKCEAILDAGQTPADLSKPKGASKPKGSFGNRSGFGGNSAFGARPGARGGNAFGANRGGGGGGGGGKKYHPVKSLNPFMKDFQIKVRVTHKQDVRTWKNAKGEGKLFNVNLLDKEGTEIQGTAFNEAVDALYPAFEVGKCYIIRKARVKISNKRFTHIKHDYQLDLNVDTEVADAAEDQDIKSHHFEFKKISETSEMKDRTFVDLIGVCTGHGEIQNFTSKAGKELTKLSFTLADNSSAAIDCTLWGDSAKSFDPAAVLNKVVALQAAKVSEYNGRSISVNTIVIEPDIPETQELKSWYSQNQGNMGSIKALTTSRGGGKNDPPIPAIDCKGKGMSGETEYFNCVLTVGFIPIKDDRDPWYKACPSPAPADANQRKCMKKVVEAGDGTWRCEGCDQDFTEYIPRWILRMTAMDHTDSLWLSSFNDVVDNLIGCSAKEAESMKENDRAGYDALFTDAVFKMYNFRLRAKMDNWNDQDRQRIDILSAEEVNISENCNRLINRTKELLRSS